MQISASQYSAFRVARRLLGICLALAAVLGGESFLHARERHKKADYGVSFSTEISSPEETVLQAVENVANNGIIQGSREYNREKFIDKATAADSSSLFPQWKDSGKVFYKVRTAVLAPANFKESQDEGTLAVRYVVQSKDATRTILRIDALFVETFRRISHASDGSVESAEYREIQDKVDEIELQQKQAEEASRKREEELARRALARRHQEEEAQAAQNAPETLEKHVQNLRRQVERTIKAPGGQLKSAPFQSASTLRPLDTGTLVVILISTSYWYGVETEDGQRGWVHHSQLEQLP